MTIAQIIAIICIGFEFCHLFYYYDIHKNIDDIVNLYNGAKVWEKAANNILKVNTNGEISEFITDIKSPYCLYISNGMLFISSQGSNTVIKKKI